MDNPFARILVAYDGSPPALAALRVAADLTEQFRGKLTVLHAADLPAAAVVGARTAVGETPPESGPMVASLEHGRRDVLEEIEQQVASRPIEVQIELATGEPAHAVIDAAVRWKATAIAIGTHGRSGVPRLMLGSVAEAVLRASSIPVLIVRTEAGNRLHYRMRHVLVGIDGSTPSEAAAAFAVRLAQSDKTRLTFCSIVETPTLPESALELSYDPTPLLSEARREAREALDGALEYARAAEIYADSAVVESHHAAEGLIEFAHVHEPDAIVLGTHGRRGLVGALLGSVAVGVARTSPAPVVVVPPA